MKKIFAIILLCTLFAVTFAGCEKKYVPDPAVEQFLNSGLTAQKAYDKLANVSYSSVSVTQNKSGEEQGRQTDDVVIGLSDKKNLSLTIDQTFSGSYVVNGVTNQRISLIKSASGYVYKKETNVPAKNEERGVDEQFANDLVRSLIFTDNGSYSDSGLYYGDMFMLKIYKYPPESFYVDAELDLCVFDEKMLIIREDIGNVRLYQTTKINRLGLLIYNKEKYEGVEGDTVLINEVNAAYKYLEEK